MSNISLGFGTPLPSLKSPPGCPLSSMYGTLGVTSSPAFIAMNGILSKSRVALVSTPGVGVGSPSSTVIAISGRLSAIFFIISSASNAGVYGVNSGLPPAPLIPGILDTAVFDKTHAKIISSLFLSLSSCFSDPYIFIFSVIYITNYNNSLLIYTIILLNIVSRYNNSY